MTDARWIGFCTGLALWASGCSQQVECGSGTENVSGRCLPLAASFCQAGTRFQSSTGLCVPQTVCPDDQFYSVADGLCKDRIRCGAGTNLNLSTLACESEDPCGPGTMEVDGSCVGEGLCGPGSQYNDATASCEVIEVCGVGTSLDEATGLCVSPFVQCGELQVQVDGLCLPQFLAEFALPDWVEPPQDRNDPGDLRDTLFELKPIGETLVIQGVIGRPFVPLGYSNTVQDVDRYAVQAKAGQYIRIKLTSAGLSQPTFTVLGPWGYRRLALAGESISATRYLVLPYDGVYTIDVQPTVYRENQVLLGGPKAKYFLSVEALPLPVAPELDLGTELDDAQSVEVLYQNTDQFVQLQTLDTEASVVIRFDENHPRGIRPAVVALDEQGQVIAHGQYHFEEGRFLSYTGARAWAHFGVRTRNKRALIFLDWVESPTHRIPASFRREPIDFSFQVIPEVDFLLHSPIEGRSVSVSSPVDIEKLGAVAFRVPFEPGEAQIFWERSADYLSPNAGLQVLTPFGLLENHLVSSHRLLVPSAGDYFIFASIDNPILSGQTNRKLVVRFESRPVVDLTAASEQTVALGRITRRQEAEEFKGVLVQAPENHIVELGLQSRVGTGVAAIPGPFITLGEIDVKLDQQSSSNSEALGDDERLAVLANNRWTSVFVGPEHRNKTEMFLDEANLQLSDLGIPKRWPASDTVSCDKKNLWAAPIYPAARSTRTMLLQLPADGSVVRIYAQELNPNLPIGGRLGRDRFQIASQGRRVQTSENVIYTFLDSERENPTDVEVTVEARDYHSTLLLVASCVDAVWEQEPNSALSLASQISTSTKVVGFMGASAEDGSVDDSDYFRFSFEDMPTDQGFVARATLLGDDSNYSTTVALLDSVGGDLDETVPLIENNLAAYHTDDRQNFVARVSRRSSVVGYPYTFTFEPTMTVEREPNDREGPLYEYHEGLTIQGVVRGAETDQIRVAVDPGTYLWVQGNDFSSMNDLTLELVDGPSAVLGPMESWDKHKQLNLLARIDSGVAAIRVAGNATDLGYRLWFSTPDLIEFEPSNNPEGDLAVLSPGQRLLGELPGDIYAPSAHFRSEEFDYIKIRLPRSLGFDERLVLVVQSLDFEDVMVLTLTGLDGLSVIEETKGMPAQLILAPGMAAGDYLLRISREYPGETPINTDGKKDNRSQAYLDASRLYEVTAHIQRVER